MRYINPKSDFAFKKIFGSPGSQGILRSFLNAVLYDAQPRIVSLEIVDPYSIPRLEGMKDSYLDVRAVLDDGQHVIIEMQVLNIPGMEKRVLYNAAKEYSNQLAKGQDYRLLNPVIALTLTDFIMFPELKNQVISRFALMEKKQLIHYPEGDVELVFVELPKFNRELDDLLTLTDEWLYFVDRASELTSVPANLAAVEEIEDAFHIAETSRLTPEEDHALEQKMHWIADQRMLLAMKEQVEIQLEQTSSQLEQTNSQLEQTSSQLEQTSSQLEQTSSQLEQTNSRLEEVRALAEQQAARAEQEAGRAKQEAARADSIRSAAAAALRDLGMSADEIEKRLAGGK